MAQECKNNPKKFWHFAKKNFSVSNSITCLKETLDTGEVIHTSSADIADCLQKYFSSVLTIESTDNIPQQLSSDNPQPLFTLRPITQAEVRTLLSSLDSSKSPGPDGIHPRLLKEVYQEISYPLTKLFNMSLTEGKVPEPWKIAQISAIHKKGPKELPSNYRLISLTSVVCKLLEKHDRQLLFE